MNLTQIYGRDSFDRFGNDLTSLIFTYFDLKTRLQTECVSKYWKCLIYNTIVSKIKIYNDTRQIKNFVTNIYIRKQDIQFNSISIIISKCRFINKLEITIATDLEFTLFKCLIQKYKFKHIKLKIVAEILYINIDYLFKLIKHQNLKILDLLIDNYLIRHNYCEEMGHFYLTINKYQLKLSIEKLSVHVCCGCKSHCHLYTHGWKKLS